MGVGAGAREELVGPAVVAVGGGAAAVGDGVADDGEGSVGGGEPGLDGGGQEPLVDALGRGGGDVRGGDEVALGQPGGGPAAGVARDGVAGLAGGEVQGDGDAGLGFHREADGVERATAPLGIWNEGEPEKVRCWASWGGSRATRRCR